MSSSLSILVAHRLNWRSSDARLFFCSFLKCSWCNFANVLMAWDPSSLFYHHSCLVDLVFIEWIIHIIAEACKIMYLKWPYVLHCNVQKVEHHMSMDFSTLMYIIYNNSKHMIMCVLPCMPYLEYESMFLFFCLGDHCYYLASTCL